MPSSLGGSRGGDHLTHQHPVERGPKVVDVRLRGDGHAVGLLRGHVPGRSLDALLHGADLAGLAEIDDLHGAVIRHHEIDGLHVRMDEAAGVHVAHAPCHLQEVAHGLRGGGGEPLIHGGGVHQLHEQPHLRHLEQLPVLQELLDAADVGVVELGPDRRFLLALVQESRWSLSDFFTTCFRA